jgi:hypothetical protein
MTPPTDERAVPFDLGTRWEPNAPDATLWQSDFNALLILLPHFDDGDQRLVVIRWEGCAGVMLSGPNDEARSGHRLYDHGLKECLWAAEVLDSEWIRDMISVNSVHPRHSPDRFEALHHWIALLKENTFEVVAASFRVERLTAEDVSSLTRPPAG